MPPPADQRPPTPTEWAVVALNAPCQRWLGTRHCAATPTRLYLGGRYCYAHAPHHQNGNNQ